MSVGVRRGEQELQDSNLDLVPALDEATVFGYACNHTATLMPLPIWLAHRLTRRLDIVRRERVLPYLAPEGKAQVGVEFSHRSPLRIHSIHVIASQQEANAPPLDRLQEEVRELVIDAVFADEPIGRIPTRESRSTSAGRSSKVDPLCIRD